MVVGQGFWICSPQPALGFLGSPRNPLGFLRGTPNLSVPLALAVFFLIFFFFFLGHYRLPVYKFFGTYLVGFELATFGELVMSVSHISRCPLGHQALSENVCMEVIYDVENRACSIVMVLCEMTFGLFHLHPVLSV